MKWNKRNNVFIKNFSSLTALQISSYIFPLITFPYLVRVLGPDNYGLVSFAAAFAAYFNILTEYGFNLSATRLVSIHRNNKTKLNELFSTVIVIRLILMVIGAIIFTAIILSVNRFSEHANVFYLSYLIVLGTAISAYWFLQGMEEMKYITYANITVRLFWVVFVFLLIRSESDVALLVLLNGLSVVLIGFLNFYAAKKIFKLKFILPHLYEIKRLLIEGWYVFISTASITLYTNSNVLILGLFAGNEIVGYYVAADKLRMAVQALFQNAATAIYPRLSNLFVNAKKQAIELVKKYLKLSLTVVTITTAILFIFSEEIVVFVLGSKYLPSVLVFRFIIFLPVIILMSNVYGIQVMLNMGYNKEFFTVIFISGIINIILSLILVPVYLEIGTSIAVLITEILVTLGMIGFVKKKKLMNEI